MATLQLTNYTCNYEFLNSNHTETIIFSNSLGTNYSMWDEVVSWIKPHFNIILHDTRGHGKSTNSKKELTIAELGEDVIEILDALKIEKAIFCGLSMGGLIGQYLGIHHPNRFKKIILANTAALIGTQNGWNDRIAFVTENGLENILTGTAERWFTPEFREKCPEKVQNILSIFVQNKPENYCANCAAVRDADFRNQIETITIPTTIISGSQDLVTTVDEGNFMASKIKNAKHYTLNANHLSATELPQQFAEILLD
nr:3-oxoadipate enol-lactonase [uncultured Flavobacterium sp.]